ncbi:hypothetical protein BCR41DRAFT_101456 [Lobosporangium transversale]|uniref:FHA domain-containing protein n=1 Tax=Lobosporangium transversale TaxID=64571 RepID=A0A1Y2GJB5_9FUNG|nr:hypothetical protein BCR41DRAFT_101456 [Lobosporangium transversale]ORZ12532.1 hypothetical protein BCR41DRAFT_101456 [Lobosporangium transversale]|eukprot:XP_021880151.1 hypothetical protein BCR41DRAFT_101456 [Lobosporangium transversale]
MFLQPTTPTNSAQERSSHLRWPESLSGAAPIPSRFSHLLNEPLVINLNNTTSEQGAASRLKEMDEEEEEKKAGVKGKEEDEGEVEEEEEEGEEEGEEEEDIVWLATPDDEILSQSLDDQEVAVYFEILEQAPLETLPLARKFCFKPNSQLVLGRAPSSGVSRLARVQQVLAQDKRRSAQAENGSDDGLFPNQVISKVHAVVYEVDGQLILEDRGSTHGTFVNEERIQSRVLQDNDHARRNVN